MASQDAFPENIEKHTSEREYSLQDIEVRNMYKNGARYNGIGPWLKDYFGMRIAKVSIDGGFTCPNRDGTLGTGGCIFCSERGSGDFAGAEILRASSGHLQSTLKPIGTSVPAAAFSSSDRPALLRDTMPVSQQIDIQIEALRKKWKEFRTIVYFQNFTNTYAPLSVLRQKYEEALSHPSCVGLAVATRPDCLSDEIISYLSELNRRTFLWVELGLQTADERTAVHIRRGYPLQTYDDAAARLSDRGIRVVTHLIAGLPGETREDFLRSVRHVVSAGSLASFGIKLQLLHIVKHTALAEQWLSQPENRSDRPCEAVGSDGAEKNCQPAPAESAENDKKESGKMIKNAEVAKDGKSMKNTALLPPIRPLTKTEYIRWISDALEIIPADVTIHRLTGDAPKDELLAPMWSRDKKSVLNGINAELKRRGTWQGTASGKK